MHLAVKAGINAAKARVELINETAVAIIGRFDRADDEGRIPYMSAATMLQSDGRDATHAYTELDDILLRDRANHLADIPELWPRQAHTFLVRNSHDPLRTQPK